MTRFLAVRFVHLRYEERSRLPVGALVKYSVGKSKRTGVVQEILEGGRAYRVSGAAGPGGTYSRTGGAFTPHATREDVVYCDQVLSRAAEAR